MIYETRITTPINTTPDAPLLTSLLVHPGHVQQVSVEFPAGCCGLVGVAIALWSHQVWPANPDNWFTGDGFVLTWPEDFDLTEGPYEFTIATYNLDDTYPHGPVVRLQVSPFGTTIEDIMAIFLSGPSGPIVPAGG